MWKKVQGSPTARWEKSKEDRAPPDTFCLPSQLPANQDQCLWMICTFRSFARRSPWLVPRLDTGGRESRIPRDRSREPTHTPEASVRAFSSAFAFSWASFNVDLRSEERR